MVYTGRPGKHDVKAASNYILVVILDVTGKKRVMKQQRSIGEERHQAHVLRQQQG